MISVQASLAFRTLYTQMVANLLTLVSSKAVFLLIGYKQQLANNIIPAQGSQFSRLGPKLLQLDSIPVSAANSRIRLIEKYSVHI